MSSFVGRISGMDIFEDEGIPIGKVYPTGKKDGNRLGKRKRNLVHSGMVSTGCKSCLKDSILVHPSKTNRLMDNYFKKEIR